MYVTPGVVVDGKLVTNDLIEINLGIRILLGSSYYDDWDGQRDLRDAGSAGQSRGQAASVEPDTRFREPQKREFGERYTWVMSPRWYRRHGDYLPLETGGGPIARLWSTALSGLVDIGYVKATGHSVKINLPKTALQAGGRVRMEDPASGSNAHRARPRAHLFPGLRGGRRAAFRGEGDGRSARGQDQDLERFQGAEGSHRLRLSPRRFAACCRITW